MPDFHLHTLYLAICISHGSQWWLQKLFISMWFLLISWATKLVPNQELNLCSVSCFKASGHKPSAGISFLLTVLGSPILCFVLWLVMSPYCVQSNSMVCCGVLLLLHSAVWSCTPLFLVWLLFAFLLLLAFTSEYFHSSKFFPNLNTWLHHHGVVKHWKSPSQNYSKKLDTIYLKVGNSFRFARVMSRLL